MKTIGQFKDSVAAILSGVDLSNVENLYGAFERAARTMIQKADIPEAYGKQNLTLYSGVYDYACDTRIFGSAIKDVRPQGNTRIQNDYVYRDQVEDFDRKKNFIANGTRVTFDYDKGTPILRVVTTLTIDKIILDTMGETTGWSALGDATSLTQDTAIYYQAPASLRFDLVAAGSFGYLEKTLTTPLDLTGYQSMGVGFLAVYLPTGTDFTDIVLRLGSDSSNYYRVASTSAFLGAFPSSEFTLVAFNLASATIAGSPDITNINYIRLGFTYNGTAQTNVRVGGLWLSLPCPTQLLYQTAAIFIPSGSTTPSTTITDDNDSIILNDAAYTVYEHEAALAVLLQTGGTLSSPMALMLKGVLHGQGGDLGLYAHYRGDNPSEKIRVIGSWYDN